MKSRLVSTAAGKKSLPPYVSYRTFWNFIEGMQQSMPARIDRSYWGERFSGSSGTQLMATLRFLELVDGNGFPTASLRELIGSSGTERHPVLSKIVQSAYDFIFDGHLDIGTATYSQLEEAFHGHYQIASDVARKCIKFFIGIAEDAEIPLSHFITNKSRATRPVGAPKKTVRKIIDRKAAGNTLPQHAESIPDGIILDKLLLDKFPAFDPDWPDDLKTKWFSAFDELLKRTGGGR